MPILHTSDRVAVADGGCSIHLSRPFSPAPVVIVLQEIFGVNDDLRATCDELAAAGYIALAPDLFWRDEPGLSLSHWTETEWKKGLSLYQSYDYAKGVADIGACVTAARKLEGATGKVGVMGFCLGGLMTFLTAAACELDAAACYYGGGTENHLEKVQTIACPMAIHLGTEDEFISKSAQAEIGKVCAGNPHITVHNYRGCSHAFARHTGTRFDAAAASLANRRTLALFAKHLTS